MFREFRGIPRFTFLQKRIAMILIMSIVINRVAFAVLAISAVFSGAAAGKIKTVVQLVFHGFLLFIPIQLKTHKQSVTHKHFES